METTYTITSHGVIKLGKLLRLDPGDKIFIYTPIGNTLYCDRSPWANEICDVVSPAGRKKTSQKKTPLKKPIQKFS